jgi:hypothetical protein
MSFPLGKIMKISSYGLCLLSLISALLMSACGGEMGDSSPSPATTRSAFAKALATPALSEAPPGNPYGIASPNAAVEQLLHFGEATLPQFFAPESQTAVFGRFRYRFYPATGIYLGVAVGVLPEDGLVEGGVYTMGGVFGDTPSYRGQLTSFITPTTAVEFSPVATSVGTAGGTAESVGGGIRLLIPEGALAASTLITINKARSVGLGSLGIEYEFGPTGTTFNVPALLSLSYDPTKLGGADENNLKLAYLSDDRWIVISDSVVDKLNHVVTGHIAHFSKVGVIEDGLMLNAALTPAFNGVVAYSNNHSSPTMVNLADGSIVANPLSTFSETDPRFTDEKNHIGPTNTLPDGHSTGEQWQCVEYIRRYYWQIYGVEIGLFNPNRNNATQFWTTAAERGLAQHSNGNPNDPPQLGDIVVFQQDASHAHVAIVREIVRGQSGDITGVKVIQQNWSLTNSDANRLLVYSNGMLETFNSETNSPSLFAVTGWLRLPSASVTFIASGKVNFIGNPSRLQPYFLAGFALGDPMTEEFTFDTTGTLLSLSLRVGNNAPIAIHQEDTLHIGVNPNDPNGHGGTFTVEGNNITSDCLSLSCVSEGISLQLLGAPKTYFSSSTVSNFPPDVNVFGTGELDRLMSFTTFNVGFDPSPGIIFGRVESVTRK